MSTLCVAQGRNTEFAPVAKLMMKVLGVKVEKVIIWTHLDDVAP